MRLMLGDCLEQLKTLADNSIDSIVTDPPYGLAFMGKRWDYDVPSVDVWRECLRVLKPGGHMLAFFGTRTYHRGVVRIEDAGFEIRDQLQWIYGSGFPKSHDVSKAIDKAAGAEREVIAERKKLESYGPNKVYGTGPDHGGIQKITAPSTDAAKQWQGFGTALKPANEPIVLARKPLDGTVAENVLKHGVGGLNIDASRIEAADQHVLDAAVKRMFGNQVKGNATDNFVSGCKAIEPNSALGRWPANVLLDEDAAAMLDEMSGVTKSSGGKGKAHRDGELRMGATTGKGANVGGLGDKGGASRFFYVAKASKRERNAGLEGMPEREKGALDGARVDNTTKGPTNALRPDKATKSQNFHPTVKPIKLMQYLVRLVTPPGGVVLDPFMGSGSTGVACVSLGFDFVGCELSEEYFEIAKRRVEVCDERAVT